MPQLNNSANIISLQNFPATPFSNIVSFLPTIVGGTTAGTGTYTTRQGYYSLLGKLCFFSINLVWTAHTGTGTLNIGNFPFTSTSSANYLASFILNTNRYNIGAGVLFAVGEIGPNTTLATTLAVRNNNTSLTINIDTAATLKAQGFYLTA